jgi:chromosome segregation ATPase
MNPVSKEEVAAAAQAVRDTGKKPTLQRVREHLGRGSYTTIGEYLKAWKATDTTSEPAMTEPVPTSLDERMQALRSELWTHAVELANGRLAAERQSLEAERTRFEVEMREASELADDLTLKLETAQAHGQDLAKQLAQQGQALEASRQEAVQARHAAELADTRNDETHASLADTKQALSKAQSDAEESRSREAAAREEAARLSGQLQALQTQLDKLMAGKAGR